MRKPKYIFGISRTSRKPVLADVLCKKWEKPYESVISFVRARLSFAILMASMLCERCTDQVENFLLDGASIDDIDLNVRFCDCRCRFM